MEKYKEIMARNRQFFIIEMITGMGQFTLVSGAFLAGFIHMLGGSDSLNGVMGAMPAVMGFMQIASSLYFERLHQRRRSILSVVTLLRVMLSIIYIVPLFFIKSGISLEIFVILYVLAFATNAILAPALMDWLVTSTPIEMRGRYLAKRERFGFTVAIILSFGLGKILDYYKVIDTESTGFMIVGIVLLILGVVNIFSIVKMKEITHLYKPMKYKFMDAVKIPLKNPGFKMVVALFIIWSFGLQIGGPFVAVYLVTHLKVSYTYIMMLTVLGTAMRIIFPSFWGRLADRKSWYLTTEASILILALTHFSWIFVTPDNYKLIVPILYIVGGFAWSGVGLSLFNLPFMFATLEGRTMFIGLNAAISGVASFIAVQLGGYIVGKLEGISLQIGPLSVDNIQIVLMLSGIILLMCPLFVRFILRNYVKHQSE
jgi:MFS family permease